jgi:hypothetical protein
MRFPLKDSTLTHSHTIRGVRHIQKPSRSQFAEGPLTFVPLTQNWTEIYNTHSISVSKIKKEIPQGVIEFGRCALRKIIQKCVIRFPQIDTPPHRHCLPLDEIVLNRTRSGSVT